MKLLCVPLALSGAIDEIPFELVSNKPFLQVQVNGSPPLWFMLDSGAGGTVIDRRVAQALGFEITQEHRAHIGAGDGKDVTIGRVGPATLHVGRRELTIPSVIAIPLAHVARYDGHRLDGLLGADFFQRFVVEIDYAACIVRTHEPAEFNYRGPGMVIPIRIQGGFEIVQADLRLANGQHVSGDFAIDSGMRCPLIFARSFFEANELRSRTAPLYPATIGGGIGGEMKGLVGRAAGVCIGGLEIEHPIVMLSDDESGPLSATSRFAGLIGAATLCQNRVFIDCFNQRLILEPYCSHAPPIDYDMSGMFLKASGADFKRFRVMSVMDDSPAREAGIQRGDRITAIDGRPSERLSLEDLRAHLRQTGHTCRLEFERAGQKRQATMKLRRLL